MQLKSLEQSIYNSNPNITCWYQPIYELNNNHIIGYEALMRSKVKDNINPFKVFKMAEISGRRTALDKHLILKAQQIFKEVEEDCCLFINIFPSTLLEKDFILWWKENSELVNSIVLEISEDETIHDWKSLKLIVEMLKERNIKIAIDDMGTGNGSIRRCIELEPDYIKLDRYFMADLSSNKIKQNVIRSIVKINNNASKIIIEGVENLNDISLLKKLGVHYAQGYALGMPSPINKINNYDKEIYILS